MYGNLSGSPYKCLFVTENYICRFVFSPISLLVDHVRAVPPVGENPVLVKVHPLLSKLCITSLPIPILFLTSWHPHQWSDTTMVELVRKVQGVCTYLIKLDFLIPRLLLLNEISCRFRVGTFKFGYILLWFDIACVY